jgi:hypothetical protein
MSKAAKIHTTTKQAPGDDAAFRALVTKHDAIARELGALDDDDPRGGAMLDEIDRLGVAIRHDAGFYRPSHPSETACCG